jgi:HJR/Mrr/RecB family endonuclease
LLLDPRQFEELIAEIWSRFGYTVELTSQTRDGGYDVVAVKRSIETNTRHLIECKRYRTDRKVDVSVVRKLYGVKQLESATKAILATTSTFTEPAKRLLEEKVWELDGKDYQDILTWIKHLQQ